jgi:hypothetical protein
MVSQSLLSHSMAHLYCSVHQWMQCLLVRFYQQTSGADIKHAIRKMQYQFSSLFMCMSYPEIGCTFFVGWGKVLLPYRSYNYSVALRKKICHKLSFLT